MRSSRFSASVIVACACVLAGCDTDSFAPPTAPISTPATLTLSVEGPRVLEVGQSERYQLIGTSRSSSGALEDQVDWESSDYSTLNNSQPMPPFDATPNYRGVQVGEADVIATYSGQTARLRVRVVASTSSPAPPTSPLPDPPPPVNQSPASLSAANGSYPITGTASPDPCTSFPLTYVGDVTISGVRDDGTGGSGLLRKNGVASAYGSSVSVRREGSGFVIEFTSRLAINGSFYDYTMRWNIGGLTPGATFTGTQALSGPCTSQGTVRGTKQN